MRRLLTYILSFFKKNPIVIVKQSIEIKKPFKKQRIKIKRLPTCIVKGKVSYIESSAKNIAKINSFGHLIIRAYKCQFCDYWHLTHKKNKLNFH